MILLAFADKKTSKPDGENRSQLQPRRNL